MIVYNLICDQQHRFEGWFDSGDEFAAQQLRGQVECPLCESKQVRKLPAGSYVKSASEKAREASLEAVRRKVIDYIHTHTEDVGPAFAEAVRKMHYQEIEPRGVRGRATPSQIQELTEEGIEVFALPVELRAPDKVH
jgi:hypothetical protein